MLVTVVLDLTRTANPVVAVLYYDVQEEEISKYIDAGFEVHTARLGDTSGM